MNMYGDNFSIRLENLSRKEAELENLLAEGGSGLDSSEVDSIHTRLIAIRAEKQELDQLVNGAFY